MRPANRASFVRCLFSRLDGVPTPLLQIDCITITLQRLKINLFAPLLTLAVDKGAHRLILTLAIDLQFKARIYPNNSVWDAIYRNLNAKRKTYDVYDPKIKVQL